MAQQVSHVSADASAQMVGVSGKHTTARTSRAEAVVQTRGDVIDMIMDAGLPKGDALPEARVSGIMAAKKTWETIPLWHPILLGKITVDFVANDDAGTESIVIIVIT